MPGIFLAKEQDTNRFVVIDGQQRLLTVLYFLQGRPDGAPFRLKGVQPHLEGKSFPDLEESDRRRLLDAIIHATVVKQDEPSNDQSSIYHLFERLNTGGTALHAQEIRSALYEGPFNDLLFKLNSNPEWRDMYGPVHKRMKDQELILRFFALLYNLPNYHRPMASFLNDFMGANRDLRSLTASDLERTFTTATSIAHDAIGRSAFRLARTLNAAVFDAIMFGIAKRLTRGSIANLQQFKLGYEQLIANQEFLDAVERSTADERQVFKRLRFAEEAFASIP